MKKTSKENIILIVRDKRKKLSENDTNQTFIFQDLVNFSSQFRKQIFWRKYKC